MQFESKLLLYLNKKQNPQSAEEWGFMIELIVDKDHIIIPSKYSGTANCGYDIALVRIPAKHQQKLVDYLHQHEKDPKLHPNSKEQYKMLTKAVNV